MAELLASSSPERTAGIAERIKNAVSDWGEAIFRSAVTEGMHIPEELVEQMEAKADRSNSVEQPSRETSRLGSRVAAIYQAAENDSRVVKLVDLISGK